MSRAPLVLIVSEHEWASRSLDSILAPRGYAVLRAYNGQQAVERAATHRPDAVFIERNLPDTSGAELCGRLRAEDAVSPATPLILMTAGAVTHGQRIEALQAGAWEILSLPMDAEELLLRLDRYTRAKVEADRAEESARTDPETGLYNQPGIFQRAYELLAAGERYGRPVACVVFEPVEGSTVADMRKFLSDTVELLRSSTRRSDIVGRIGQRRFVIVTPDTPQGGAEVLADRLRERATRERGFELRVGAFGVPDVRATAIEPDELVKRAMGASRGSGPEAAPWN